MMMFPINGKEIYDKGKGILLPLIHPQIKSGNNNLCNIK
jgi:hypothetical protein